MFPRDIVCLRNMSIRILHKEEEEDDDDDDDDDDNNNSNNNKAVVNVITHNNYRLKGEMESEILT